MESILRCPDCKKDIYKYDDKALAESMYPQAGLFTPVSEDVPAPQQSDPVKCPLCGSSRSFRLNLEKAAFYAKQKYR